MKCLQFFNTLLAILVFYVEVSAKTDYNIVCYYRTEPADDPTRLQPQAIDTSLCTHVIVAFALVINGTLQPTKAEDVQIYKNVLALRSQSPHLKVLLAVGGGGSAAGFPSMVKTKESRAKFITQAVDFLKNLGFDGFDIDWEFPSWAKDPHEDRILFGQFLKEFRAYVGKDYILTVDVAGIEPLISVSYDISSLSESVTFVNIMCYDFHLYHWYFPFTGHNSPLYQLPHEFFYLNTLNTNFSVHYWIQRGIPPSKINMGIPTYGNTWKLVDPKENEVYALSNGVGFHDGSVTYPMVCSFLNEGGTDKFDNDSKVPYAYRDFDWISYESVQSIAIKAEFVTTLNLAGVMTFNLNCDDWNGLCPTKTKFPLHKALKNALISNEL